MADESELGSNIRFFAKSHCELINAEYEEEKRAFKYDTSRPEIGNLEKRGVLINDLAIISVRNEYGTCIVDFRRTTAKRHTGPLLISCGDIASIWYHDEDAENKKTCLASGTVMNITDIVKISFDSSNPFHWDHELKYFMVKTLSEVTYSRMRNALQNIIHHTNGRCSMIIKYLFGFERPERNALHRKFLSKTGELKFYNDHLHFNQKDAVRFCLEQSNFAVIHGPPGTGKTTVLVEVILQLVNTGHKILVCAPSNIAVDTVVEKLDAIKNKIIRVGKTARMLESSKISSLGAAYSSSDNAPIIKEVKTELDKYQRELGRAKPAAKAFLRHEVRELRKEYYLRQYRALQELLRNANVVLTTLTSASDDGDLKNVPPDHFDVLIIDECSQAIEAACWIAIPRAPKLIVAGDHLQLPPTIKSRTALDCGLGVSLMERAILRMGGQCYKLLTHQFRMNQYIMQWVSRFYSSSLEADEKVAKRLLKDLPDVKETEETDTSLLLVDTAGFEQMEKDVHGSKFNESEANVVAVLVNRLIDAGVPQSCISVITPYSMQVSCIKIKLSNYSNIEVRTVDGFQGREKEAVIISLVRSNRRRDLGFLTDKRRLNVAVSRAQSFLAIIGDCSTVKKDGNIHSLLKHIEVNGVCYSAHEFTREIDALAIPEFNPYRHDPSANRGRLYVSRNQRRENNTESNRNEPVASTSRPSTSNGSRPGSSNSSRPGTSNSCPGGIKGKEQTKTNVEDLRRALRSIHIPSPRKEQIASCNVTKTLSFDILDSVESSDSELTENVECASGSGTPNLEIKCKTQSKTKQAKSQSKKSSKSKLSEDTSESDDDMKAIQESLKRNTTCFMVGCKASVKLYPQLCQHCHEVYCLAHMLPEVHGCGEAAKRSARHNFRHDQRPKSVEKDKNVSSKKLKEKVAQKAAERKRQTKK